MTGRGAVHLYPGEIFHNRHPYLVTTLLGSCVAVCLWDRHRRHGGLTHALLPFAPTAPAEPGRYADTAVSGLVAALESIGSRRGDLLAKVFGGGDVLPLTTPGGSIGRRNVESAIARLRLLDIPVACLRVGGTRGVVVKFDTGRGEAWVRPMSHPDQLASGLAWSHSRNAAGGME